MHESHHSIIQLSFINNISPLSYSTPVELSLILLPALISITSLHPRSLLSWYLRLRCSRFLSLSGRRLIHKSIVHLFIVILNIELFRFTSPLARSRRFGLDLIFKVEVDGEGGGVAVVVRYSFARRKICESSLSSSVRTT
jgi:hypothetical protein